MNSPNPLADNTLVLNQKKMPPKPTTTTASPGPPAPAAAHAAPAKTPYRFGVDPLPDYLKDIKLVDGKIIDQSIPGSVESVTQYIEHQQRAIDNNNAQLDGAPAFIQDMIHRTNTELQQQIDNAKAVLAQYQAMNNKK